MTKHKNNNFFMVKNFGFNQEIIVRREGKSLRPAGVEVIKKAVIWKSWYHAPKIIIYNNKQQFCLNS